MLNLTKIVQDAVLAKFDEVHSGDFALDGKYSDREMIEALTAIIKKNVETDREFVKDVVAALMSPHD